MASENAFTLRLDFDAPEFAGITEAQRKLVLKAYSGFIQDRKHWEIDRALDAESGEKMPARQKPRPDGADGPVLAPHNRRSRTHRYMRASIGKSHVTVWWSHGWGTVLGYHADGVVIGAYKRDHIGLTPAGERKVNRQIIDYWRRIRPKAKAASRPKREPATPERAPAGMPVQRRPGPRPIGERPGPQPTMHARPGGRPTRGLKT